VWERDGDADAARQEAHASIQLTPNVPAWLVLARLDLQANQLGAAASDVGDALRIDPGECQCQRHEAGPGTARSDNAMKTAISGHRTAIHEHHHGPLFLIALILLFLLCLLGPCTGASGGAEQPGGGSASRRYDSADQRRLSEAWIDRAAELHAQAVLVELNTPEGCWIRRAPWWATFSLRHRR